MFLQVLVKESLSSIDSVKREEMLVGLLLVMVCLLLQHMMIFAAPNEAENVIFRELLHKNYSLAGTDV